MALTEEMTSPRLLVGAEPHDKPEGLAPPTAAETEADWLLFCLNVASD